MASVNFHHALAATHGAKLVGKTSAELLQQAGINPLQAERPNARVTDTQMTRLVQSIWLGLEDEFMGFTEHECKLGSFAFMLTCIRTSPDLFTALKQGCQFYNLVTDDINTEVTTTSKTVEISFSFAKPELDPERFFHEFWFVIWHRLACWLTGVQIPLIEIHFNYDKPSHSQELELMFPCKHAFSKISNKIVFDKSFAGQAIVRSKTEVNNFLKHSPFDLLTIPGFDSSFTTLVSQSLSRIHHHTQSFVNLKEVAKELNISQATLHRRLIQEGSSFQEIKDELKRELAINLLTLQHMPVYEVAEKVGFSDARSLTRAFKKWTGLTPRSYLQLNNK